MKMENTMGSLRVSELLKFTIAHNSHREALVRVTGAHFNIFQILRVGHHEVTTHSPILGELLDRKGKHGQGAVFLRLFLGQFHYIQDFDAESATIKLEDGCGQVTEDSGGRIDIVVKDRYGKIILIENKIFARDQPKQMQRYRKEHPNAIMFYLTLEGKKPNGLSDEEVKDINFNCISYKTDILAWLKKCREAAVCLPNVRETITQYIHLIEELTNQSTNIFMSKELIDTIIKDKETYLAYTSLRKEQWNINKAIIVKVNAQLETIGKDLGLETLEEFAGQSKPAENYFYTTPAMKAQNLKFGLRCAESEYRNFSFGFAYKDLKLKSQLDSSVFALCKEAFGKKVFSNDFWPAGSPWEHHSTWGEQEMAAIISGEFQDLEALIRKLDKVANEASKTPAAAT